MMFPRIQMKGDIAFLQPAMVLPSKLHLSSSCTFKCRCRIASPTSVGVSPRDPEKLSARERRKLRNERREHVKGSKLSWREEVENKLSEKVKKPKSWMDEMNLNHMAAKGPQWWMIMTPKNSEQVVVDRLSTTFPVAFPDIEFQVYLPQLPFRRKLKDGSYSESKKKLFPGWVFIRCPMNREIHEFVRNCSGVRGFFGTKIGNVFRQMVKPSAVPIAEMEAIYKQVKEAQEEYEHAIEDEQLKEERDNEVEQYSAGQDEMLEDLRGRNPSRVENANHYQDFVTEIGNTNTSGKQIGSLGKMKAASKKLLKTSTDYSGPVNDLSVKGFKKNKSSIRRDDLSRKQDSLHLVKGSTVRITSGPFAQFTGQLKEFNGETLKVKGLYVGKDFVGDVPLHKKILAALTTGAIAITVASPTDLVKVRLQAEGKLPPGVPRRYSGAMNAYATIVRQEGLGALWTGLGPNVARNAIINAAELASYDQVKQTLLKLPGFSDNVFTHLLSGLGAGFFAVCIGSPVDVVKSRMMGDSKAYKNTLDCFIKTLRNDGPLAFYKGFVPNFGRLGSWNVIMFLTLEQAKKFFTKEVPS